MVIHSNYLQKGKILSLLCLLFYSIENLFFLINNRKKVKYCSSNQLKSLITVMRKIFEFLVYYIEI